LLPDEYLIHVALYAVGMAFKAKIDPVPWNIYIRAANDLDVDKLINSIKEQLARVLPITSDQLQQMLKELNKRGRDEPSRLNELANHGVNIFMLMAQLEILERLKDHMTPRPPIVLSEAEATRIADARWRDLDTEYDWWTFSTATKSLMEHGLVKLRRLPKTQGCRYTFVKPPNKYPNAYGAFRRIAEYYQEDLGYEGTTFVGLWAKARGTPGRVVVTAAVAKAGRKEPRPPEPPLDGTRRSGA
jgi:hypothetical protein